jgi:adenylate kinase family enzyme
MINVIFVLGGPGSGKGTLCKNLEKDGWIHVSVGELLREHAKKDSNIEKLLKKGNLVTSEMSVNILENYLNNIKDNSKVLIDGFPRNITNWETLMNNKIIKKININCIIFLETTKEIMLSRVVERSILSLEKRSDDNVEIFENRYKLYLDNLKILENPDIGRMLIRVDSSGSTDEVYENVKNIISIMSVI